MFNKPVKLSDPSRRIDTYTIFGDPSGGKYLEKSLYYYDGDVKLKISKEDILWLLKDETLKC